MKRVKIRTQQPRRKPIRNAGRLVRGANSPTTTDPTPAPLVLPPCLTIDLEFPIEIDGRELSTLTLRHPTHVDVAWYRSLRGSGNDRGLALVARVCDVPKDALLELDHIDTERLIEQCIALGEGA